MIELIGCADWEIDKKVIDGVAFRILQGSL